MDYVKSVTLFCLTLMLSLGGNLRAQTNRTFTTTGNWNTATNWTGSSIADVITERATINASRTATIISPNNYTIAQIDVNSNSTLTINSGATLNIGTSGTANNFNMYTGSTLNVYGNLVIWGDLALQDNAPITIRVFSTGSITIKDSFWGYDDLSLTIDAGGSMSVVSDIDFDNDATVVVNGSLSTADDIWFDDNLSLTIGSTGSVTVADEVDIQNNATIVVNGLFDVNNNFITDDDLTLTIGSTGVVDVAVDFNIGTDDNAVITVAGDLIIGDDFVGDVGISLIVQNGGDVTVGDDIALGDDAVITVNAGGDMSVADDITLDDDAVITVSGTLSVTDNFTGDVNTDFVVNGLVNIGGDLDVDNNSDASGTGSIVVGGTCADGTSANFCGTGPLPVTLTYFTATVQGTEVACNWATASQLNFSHFEIERSNDGAEWSMLHALEGAGTTNELLSYSYIDEQPLLGTSYYRLRMVDLDQTVEFSPIQSTLVEGSKSIVLSPNPASNGKTTYHLNFVPKSGTITVFDLTGMEVYRAQTTETSAEIVLPATITAGTYFVRYTGAEGALVARLLVR
jgi:hypothetical protein